MEEDQPSRQLIKRLQTHKQLDFYDELGYGKNTKVKKSHQDKILENLKAGITVGLVNMPLCISMAVSSGATPSIGIMSSFYAGLIGGIIGGSNYNIIGPSGSTIGLIAALVSKYGIHSVPYFAIVTGILLLIVKIYSLEKNIDLFPDSVNKGFSLGIAFIIFFGQMNNALGIGQIKAEKYIIASEVTPVTAIVETEDEETLLTSIIENLSHLNQANGIDLFIYLIFFGPLLYLLNNHPKVPWVIVFAVLGCIVGMIGLDIDTLQSRFGSISVVLFDFSYLTKMSPLFLLDLRMWIDAVPVAFVAVLETLVAAKVADSQTGTRFHKQREIRGLVTSNLVVGILGGMPVTAAMSRTMLNLKSGATHKYSSAVSSVTLFILAGLFIGLFKYLPLPVVAAIVCTVAVRMVNIDDLKKLYENDRTNFYITVAVAAICIIRDPMNGMIFGMLIYLIIFCNNLTKPWTEIILNNTTASPLNVKSPSTKNNLHSSFEASYGDIPKTNKPFIVYRIIGILNFMNVTEHTDKLKALATKEHCQIYISLKYLQLVDLDALHAIKLLIEKVGKVLKESETDMEKSKIIITGISKSKLEIINNEEWINKLIAENAVILEENTTVTRPKNLEI